MFLGVQIVSVCVIISVMIGFKGMRKLPILSTVWYNRFLLVSLLNFVCEAVSLYTLYRMDELPAWVNDLAHVVFYISIVMALHCYLFFIDIKGRRERRYTRKELVLRSASSVLMVPVLLHGEIQYYVNGNVRYSYGTMVDGVTAIVALYVICFYILVLFYNSKKNRLTFHEVRTFLFTFVIVTIVLLVQMFVPNLLMTSMAIMFLGLNVYTTFENPREHADQEIQHALNRNAFLVMVNEHVQSKKEFYIVSLTLSNSRMLKDSKGYNETLGYVDAAANYLIKYGHTELVYHPKRDWVSLIFTDKEKYNSFIEEQKTLFINEGHDEHGGWKVLYECFKMSKICGLL